MPHRALRLIPGVDTTRTPALNEAAFSESTAIRFMADRQDGAIVQKLGGWQKYNTAFDLSSSVRALHAWTDTNGISRLGIGMEPLTLATYDTTYGYNDRTPQKYSTSQPVAFSTTSGSPTVTISDPGSNVLGADGVDFITPVAVGGLVLSGFYVPTAVSADTYQVTAVNVIGTPVNATSTVAGGGAVPSFATTNGSSVVTVTLANHGQTVGSTFTIRQTITLGGVTLYGNFVVLTVPSSSTFTIRGFAAATSTTSASLNGGLLNVVYYPGIQSPVSATGFGDGGFGDGGFGTGVAVGIGRTVTPTAISTVGTTATVTFAEWLLIRTGSTIVLSGVTPAAYNGTWTVTGSTYAASSTVSFDVGSTPGAMTIAGTLTITDWRFYPATTDWALDNWGENLLACPRLDSIYTWSPDATQIYGKAARLGNAPSVNEGMFVAMPQRQIMAYGSTFTGIQDPLLIRWCDAGDNTDWVATPTNQAGSYRLPRGSRIVGGMQGPQQTLFWTDLGVWGAQYIGPPYIYSFNELGSGCGLIARKAAGAAGGTVYWMGKTQFYRLAGGWPEVIPCPIWDKVFQNIDLSATAVEYMRCAVNTEFNEITWYYCPNDGSNTPSQYAKFNFMLNQWDYGTLTRTAWIDQSALGPPLGANDVTIYQHETAPDADGAPLVSGFKTGYFALSDGDAKVFIDQIWPDMKWGLDGAVPNASVQLYFYTADYPGQTPTTFGPFTMTQAVTFLTPRLRARLVAIELRSTDLGSFWRLGNIRYRAQNDGVF